MHNQLYWQLTGFITYHWVSLKQEHSLIKSLKTYLKVTFNKRFSFWRYLNVEVRTWGVNKQFQQQQLISTFNLDQISWQASPPSRTPPRVSWERENALSLSRRTNFLKKLSPSRKACSPTGEEKLLHPHRVGSVRGRFSFGSGRARFPEVVVVELWKVLSGKEDKWDRTGCVTG